MFTKVLAMELAEHRINVNCVAPGVIDTNPQIPQRASRMNEEFRTALLQAIPWGPSAKQRGGAGPGKKTKKERGPGGAVPLYSPLFFLGFFFFFFPPPGGPGPK